MKVYDWLFRPRFARVSRPTNPTHLRVEALEDRLTPASTVSIDNVTMAVGVGTAGFTLTRSGDTTQSVKVSYTTSDGTATAGTDYTPTSGTITFASGQTVASLPVPVLTHDFEGSLTFSVNLTGISVVGLGSGSFTTQQTFPTGSQPQSVTIADVNGDGKPDLIVTSEGTNTVDVLLNNTPAGATTPSFAPQQTFATGGNPTFVTAADLNGDGKPDLVVTNFNDGTVSVLLNTTATNSPTASFTTSTFSAGATPFAVAVTDVNGDGQPDLVVVNTNAGNAVTVLLNTTNGAATPSFVAQAPLNFTDPTAIAVADVNGDGKPDLVVTSVDNGGEVSVLLNTTATNAITSSFAAPYTAATGAIQSVTVGDINGDGKPDIIAANNGAGTVSVFLNTTAANAAAASFATPQTLVVGNGPASVTTADVNGDGKLDLVVANNTDDTVAVLLNTTAINATSATFAAPQAYAIGANTQGVATADLNADGKPDIVATNFNDSDVSVLLNTTTASVVTPGTATIVGDESSTPVAPPVAVTRSVSVAFGPQGEVLAVVDSTGLLTQYSSAGAFALASGVASASVAFGPQGEVLVVTYLDGTLMQYSSAGAFALASGVLSATVTFGPQGEVLEVVDSTGLLTQYSSAGAFALASGVSSAATAFGPGGQQLLVVGQDGTLTLYSAAGAAPVFGGVLSAGLSFGGSGAVYVVLFADGTLVQYDPSGVHPLATIA